MSLRSTFLAVAESMTPRTLSTAMGARTSEFWDTTLLLRQVVTASIRDWRSVRSTGLEISSRMVSALLQARRKEEAIWVGWIPWGEGAER